jgi:hypothetical protein
MRTWSGQIRAGDRYGLVLLARVFLGEAQVASRNRLAVYLRKPARERQFWLDDYYAFFPEELN